MAVNRSVEARHRPTVRSCYEAVENIAWYAMRAIDVLHKVLKSGLQSGKLNTPQRGSACQSDLLLQLASSASPCSIASPLDGSRSSQ